MSDELHQAMVAARAALNEARSAWYAMLPELPGNGICPACGTDLTDERGVLAHVEEGYERTTDANVMVEWSDEVDYLILTPADAPADVHLDGDRGWEGFSEEGDFEYLQCNPFHYPPGCGQAFKISEKMTWHG